MSEQAEELRLADALENLEATGYGGDCFELTAHSEKQANLAAAELRRLHAERQLDREAMRRALEALEHCTYDEEGYSLNPDNEDAIVALRERLNKSD